MRICVRCSRDASNAAARLSQGSLDLFDRLRPADLASLGSAPGVKTADAGPGPATDHLWFNLNDAKADGTRLDNTPKHAWCSDRRFRVAIAHAIDRETIAASTLRGLATPMYGFLSPGNKLWLSSTLPKIAHDPAMSERLLAEAGFVKKGTPDAPELYDANGTAVEFTLIVPAENEPRKMMAAIIQEDLAKLGIKMQIAPIEFRAVTERWTKTLDYDAILLGLSITDLEPSSLGSFLLSSSDSHQWHPREQKPAIDSIKKVLARYQALYAPVCPG